MTANSAALNNHGVEVRLINFEVEAQQNSRACMQFKPLCAKPAHQLPTCQLEHVCFCSRLFDTTSHTSPLVMNNHTRPVTVDGMQTRTRAKPFTHRLQLSNIPLFCFTNFPASIIAIPLLQLFSTQSLLLYSAHVHS